MSTEPIPHINGGPKTTTAEDQIDAQVRQAIGFLVRGILVSAPGLPVDMVVKSISRVTGELMGQAVAGDLTSVLTIRRECKEAFAGGMHRMPITPTGQVQKLSS